jgi:hypothetical protein
MGRWQIAQRMGGSSSVGGRLGIRDGHGIVGRVAYNRASRVEPSTNATSATMAAKTRPADATSKDPGMVENVTNRIAKANK